MKLAIYDGWFVPLVEENYHETDFAEHRHFPLCRGVNPHGPAETATRRNTLTVQRRSSSRNVSALAV